VPLNRPALSLGTGPRGVQDARRWVVGTFRDIGRDDLVECAEMGVSELVTNALLHGTSPIQVRVRGTREHPRVEVGDGSTDPPALPRVSADDDLDDLLTFGRGLSIVARASEAWGAELEDDGKTVWFVPAREFSDDVGPEGLITGVTTPADQTGEQPADPMKVHLLGVPVKDYSSFQNHFRELRREVRLLAMAHESDYPLARDLAEVFNRLGRPLTLGVGSAEIVAAQDAGRAVTDL
jgi:anti-sigma regulatory factor (Ser/Thr protein kinase)